MRRGTGATSGIPRGDALGIGGLAPLLLANLEERIVGPRPRRLAMPLQMPAVWRQRAHPAPGVAARAVRGPPQWPRRSPACAGQPAPWPGHSGSPRSACGTETCTFYFRGACVYSRKPGAGGSTSAALPPAVPGQWPRPSAGPAAEALRPPPPYPAGSLSTLGKLFTFAFLMHRAETPFTAHRTRISRPVGSGKRSFCVIPPGSTVSKRSHRMIRPATRSRCRNILISSHSCSGR